MTNLLPSLTAPAICLADLYKNIAIKHGCVCGEGIISVQYSMCESVFSLYQSFSAQTPASVSQTPTGSPCHIKIGDVEKDEEAFVVGRLGFMRMKDWTRLGHHLQV